MTPLTNFGAILGFAEEMEKEDLEIYQRLVQAAPDADRRRCFTQLVEEGKKSLTLVRRTRQENVTEMILEPIRDFSPESYRTAAFDSDGMDIAALEAAAVLREERAIRYYRDAAEKIRALPEVSRALKTLAKKREKRIDALQKPADSDEQD
jgi:rubrerythrin